jgi:hypothetical protein
MTQATERPRERSAEGSLKGLGYPFLVTVAGAARDPDGRNGPEREQDGTV